MPKLSRPAAKPTRKSLAASPKRQISKKQLVSDLLARPQGASLAEMVEATGWLAHTTRAALTRLRKSGINVVREKADGATRYHIGPVA